MNEDITKNDTLTTLLNATDEICVSIIIPIHRHAADKDIDRIEIKNIVQRAKQYMHCAYNLTDANLLATRIDELSELIKNNNAAYSGLGLFISPSVKELIHFSFPVTEKLVFGSSFQIRELLYESYFTSPYLALRLARDSATLFHGMTNKLKIIHEHGFPKLYEELYEHGSGTRGSSYVGNGFTKQFEKGKSDLADVRFDEFLRDVDKALKSLIDDQPLVISGTVNDVAEFRKITHCEKNIVAQVTGNYSHGPLSDFGDAVWAAYKEHLDTLKTRLVNDLKEKIGNGLGVTGISEIWEAASSGRGQILIVEKGYSVHGFKQKDADKLYLDPPTSRHAFVQDAVNELIKMTLLKKGRVIIVEDGTLNEFRKIALMTRY